MPDRCVVSQYHSFVTKLGAGASRLNYCIRRALYWCICAVKSSQVKPCLRC